MEPHETFYGTDDAPMSTQQIRRARTWCMVCPVQPDCLATALGNRERHGVWGGLTPRERARLLEKARGSIDRALRMAGYRSVVVGR